MFRHVLRPKAISSLRRLPAIINGPRLRHISWSRSCSRPRLTRTATPARSRVSHARRSIATLPSDNDTIYALSTAPGRAAIAIIRISGPACADIHASLCPAKPLPKPRHAVVRTLYSPAANPGTAGGATTILDPGALVLSFPAPHTVTGEDVLELHVHGGAATVKAVLSAIARCRSSGPSRIRYALPGEFTRRAFAHARLDLAQVEALADTLAAETEQQRRAAAAGAAGALGRAYDAWRGRLLLARAEVEALIDFAEDQHFDESPAELMAGVAGTVRAMVADVRRHEEGSRRGELVRGGVRVALLGPPNAGKSSLMNLVVGREASIVSREAGTTRDVVEVSLDVGGFLCSFADTAGFRAEAGGGAEGDGAAVGAVEREGIRRARRKAREADVVVVLASVEEDGGRRRIVYDPETLRLAAAARASLVVVNKRDAAGDGAEMAALVADFRARAGLEADPIAISCREAADGAVGGGEDGDEDPGGVHGLVSALAGVFGELTAVPDDMQDLLGVTERQRQLLAECRRHLEAFLAEARAGGEEGEGEGEGDAEADVVLAAEHLRAAASCLARITGRGEGGDVEEVLGVIFEKFCVGK